MTLDFTCQSCEGGFELDSGDLADGSEALQCPHCDVKAPQSAVDDFVAALTELKAQVASLGKRFAVNLTIETEEVEEEVDEEEEEDDEDVDDDDEDDDDDLDDDDEEEPEDEDDDK